MEDYANLAFMFKEFVEENAKLVDKNEKFKITLEERLSPYIVEKEKEIQTLKSMVDELTLREGELETLKIQIQHFAAKEK